jgi:hypothetical protein
MTNQILHAHSNEFNLMNHRDHETPRYGRLLSAAPSPCKPERVHGHSHHDGRNVCTVPKLRCPHKPFQLPELLARPPRHPQASLQEPCHPFLSTSARIRHPFVFQWMLRSFSHMQKSASAWSSLVFINRSGNILVTIKAHALNSAGIFQRELTPWHHHGRLAGVTGTTCMSLFIAPDALRSAFHPRTLAACAAALLC